MTSVRVRGIYTTAVTQLLGENGLEVVQASGPIRERFDRSFEATPADVTIYTTRDRQGSRSPGSDAVETVCSQLEDVAIDAFRWDADVPRERSSTRRCSRQVAAAAHPLTWATAGGAISNTTTSTATSTPVTATACRSTSRRRRGTTIGRSSSRPSRSRAVSVRSHGIEPGSRRPFAARGEELVGMTDLLSTDVPEGWGLRWRETAADADLEAMGEALEDGVDRLATLEDELADAPAEPGEPGELAEPRATAWLWFGRESRFTLDDARREVETTMVGHHRTKAADRAASAAVDFAEAVCGSP